MVEITEQMKKWKNEFGKEYTDRNVLTLNEMNELYRNNYGIARLELNNLFVGELDRSVRILEIGSNVGNQLLLLQEMGFKNLYGIEINPYAVELSKSRTKNISIIQGSAFEVPFRNDCFSCVFTSGLLIHIAPSDMDGVMQEIHRCTEDYIWGFEYYANECTETTYRGHKNLLWKADFAKLYSDRFSDLELVKTKQLKYLNCDNVDSMFLLRKRFGR